MAVTFTNDPSAHTNKPHGKEISYGWEEGYKALKLKIDGLSFTYDVPTKHKAYIKASLIGLGEDPLWKPLKQTKMYSLRRELRHPKTGETILIEAAPPPPPGLKAPVSYLRLKFNPSKLGPDGVEFLRDQLLQVFLIEHSWSLIATNCTVTQMDIAADLLGINTRDLLVWGYKPGSAKGKPLKRMMVTSASGELETLCLGLNPVKVRIYNKAQELVDNKQPSKFGSTPYTRIEMITKPGRPISKLATMSNPFEKLKIGNLTKPVEPPDGMHYWSFFLDACRLHGTEAALALLPKETLRGAYADALTESDLPVWKPDKLWKNWPSVLASSKLLP